MRIHRISRLGLADWRRQVQQIYARVRASEDREAAWNQWREDRDRLFASHSQSPLNSEARASFGGLDYFPYDPAFRLQAEVEETPWKRVRIADSGGGEFEFDRFARANFELDGTSERLELYWLNNYAGGIFLSFRDSTSGSKTYGAGRYLLDTAKGADLGNVGSRLVLDFNFAYQPSCSYNPKWVCPLAPPENSLGIEIAAGERLES